MKSGTALFLDTSIQISRFFKSDDLKRKIEETTARFDLKVTGLVVRNEFRRRVLSEAQYLLRLLDKYQSARRVQQHVNDELGGFWNQRKRNICLDLLASFYPQSDDQDHTARLTHLLRSLILTGLEDFDDSVDSVIFDSSCACGKQSVREISPYKKYDIGIASCKAHRGMCGIKQFVANQRGNLCKIRDYLQGIPSSQKTAEINQIEVTVTDLLFSSDNAEERELCNTVGDLLIALESSGIPNFYTQNIKESQHLCRPLNQTLLYRKNHPAEGDVIYEQTAASWPVV